MTKFEFFPLIIKFLRILAVKSYQNCAAYEMQTFTFYEILAPDGTCHRCTYGLCSATGQ